MIYKRYLVKEVLKVFFGIVLALFLFFSIANLTAELKTFYAPNIRFYQIVAYQGAFFAEILPVLIPFVLLIASLKVYCSLASHKELVALTSGGISKQAIVRPLILVGCFLCLFLYVGEQWIFPYSSQWKATFNSEYLKKEAARKISQITLPNDAGEIIFSKYQPSTDSLIDAYWLKSAQEIWHFKEIDLPSRLGHFADHLVQQEGKWRVIESETSMTALPAAIATNKIRSQLVSIEAIPFSKLIERSKFSLKKIPNRSAKITTRFYHQLFLPMTCLFAVIIPAPFCLNFNRQYKPLSLFLWTLLGGICYLILVDVSCVLSRAQLLPPLIAMCTLPLCLCLWSVRSYARLQ